MHARSLTSLYCERATKTNIADLPPAAVNPLNALPVPVLEEHVGLSGRTRSISGKRDDPDHALKHLIR